MTNIYYETGHSAYICAALELPRCLTGMLFEDLAEILVIMETDLIRYLIHHFRRAAQQALCLVYPYVGKVIRKVLTYLFLEQTA